MEILKEVLVTLVDFIEKWGEMIIAVLSLVIAIIALKKSSKAEKLQNRINEMEVLIKEYELEQIEKEKEKENTFSSCVEARAFKIGNGKYRLKVWNSGDTKVYSVNAKFDGNPGIMIVDNEKQPFDELEPGKSYELAIIPYGQYSAKFKIITEWKDENGSLQIKSQMGDL